MRNLDLCWTCRLCLRNSKYQQGKYALCNGGCNSGSTPQIDIRSISLNIRVMLAKVDLMLRFCSQENRINMNASSKRNMGGMH